ncbi:unnamed protein product [Gadus morhua 'NCC']
MEDPDLASWFTRRLVGVVVGVEVVVGGGGGGGVEVVVVVVLVVAACPWVTGVGPQGPRARGRGALRGPELGAEGPGGAALRSLLLWSSGGPA